MGHTTAFRQFSDILWPYFFYQFMIFFLVKFCTDISSPGDLFYNFLISHISSFVFFPYLHIILTIRNFIKILPPSFQYQSVISNSTIIPVCTNNRWWLAFSLHPSRYCIEFSCFISLICFLHSSQQRKIMGICFLPFFRFPYIPFSSLCNSVTLL